VSILGYVLAGAAVYVGYHILKGYLGKEPSKTFVQGKPKTKSLDFDQLDVEDAHFEDIPDEEK
jgi:hypothetical protein